MTTFEALLKSRRSIRDFTEQQVELTLIQEIIAESTLAPNASNEQPWRFVIVQDKNYIRRISDESKKNILASIANSPQNSYSRYEKVLRDASFNVFYNAPSLVIIAGPATKRSLHVDCALAASYFMLAAATRGLGSCWVNLGAYIQDRSMRSELGLSEEMEVVAPIIVGYPKQIPPVPQRQPPQIVAIING